MRHYAIVETGTGVFKKVMIDPEILIHGAAKQTRAQNISGKTVTTTAGHTLDTNEISLDRMDRVISVAMAKLLLRLYPNEPEWQNVIPWIDANNVPQSTITVAELVEAQYLGLTALATEFVPL